MSLVHEADTGKVLKNLPTGEIVANFALSPEGKTLLWQKGRGAGEDEQKEWVVEGLVPSALMIPAAVFRGDPIRFDFTPDGRYLLGVVQRRKADEREVRLHVWDVKAGFRETASVAADGAEWERGRGEVAVSTTEQFVVVITDRRKEVLIDWDTRNVEARVYSLPDLKPVKSSASWRQSPRTRSSRSASPPTGSCYYLGMEEDHVGRLS